MATLLVVTLKIWEMDAIKNFSWKVAANAMGPWRWPPESLALANDEVHVWFSTLDLAPRNLDRMEELISPGERCLARRFHFAKDRNQFIVRRAVLRMLLGNYTGLAPRQLQFCLGPAGKPYLDHRDGGNPIMFSLSHSREAVLYGFVRCRRIGVDLEFIHAIEETERIVSHFFSDQENGAFHSLPEDQRQEAFFRYWTGKEAFLKALGHGLPLGLDQFDIALGPGAQLRLGSVKWDPEEAAHWSLEALKLPLPEFIAALAVEGSDWRLKPFVWQGACVPE